ncbi:Bifunctional protein GlmU [Candidatus Entotheonellaceae bacterium PAL068K]
MTSPLSPLAIVILGAGKGTRMQSSLPKVMHPLAGRPLLSYVLDLALRLVPQRLLVVVGYQAEAVRALCELRGVTCVVQEPQLGTGHAVMQTALHLADFQGDVLVLYGDVPLLQLATLRRLWRQHQKHRASVTVLTVILDDPTGYGRIVRDAQGRLLRITEERDATEAERAIAEVNSGMYYFQAQFLYRALRQVEHNNAQGEQYLTDVVAVAVAEGHSVAHKVAPDPEEIMGVNTRLDLARLEAVCRRRG